MKNETIKEILIRLSQSNISSEQDSKLMQYLLRNLEYKKAVVVSGIVYLEGYGNPINIHSVSKKLLKAFIIHKKELI